MLMGISLFVLGGGGFPPRRPAGRHPARAL